MERKLQVFVSSTYLDMREERQAAVAAILRARHIPAGMELFAAGNNSQLDVIKQWIDESDCLLLLLGGRYGTVEPSSGKSYIELEYDYAVSKGKPVFGLVIDESALDAKVKLMGHTVIETEHSSDLRVFRDKVLSRLCAFYRDEKDILSEVIVALNDLTKLPELTGWVSASSVSQNTGAVLDQMSYLMGRVNELELENVLLAHAQDNPAEDQLALRSMKEMSSQPVSFLIDSGDEDDSILVRGSLLDMIIRYKSDILTARQNTQSELSRELWKEVIPLLEMWNLVILDDYPDNGLSLTHLGKRVFQLAVPAA